MATPVACTENEGRAAGGPGMSADRRWPAVKQWPDGVPTPVNMQLDSQWENVPEEARRAHDLLKPIHDAAMLAGPQTRHQVDELASRLHARSPWMQPVSESIWKDMCAHVAGGGDGLWFRPVVLDGPPGIGKTAFARNLATEAGAPFRIIDAGQASAAFRVAGVEKGWSTASPGVPLEAIASTRCANPVIIVDDIDKAEDAVYSSSGFRSGLISALLGLLEPGSAQDWECCFCRGRFDMSRICWILTSNDVERIAPPLRDRCRIFRLSPPTAVEEHEFLRREALQRFGDERGELLAELFASQCRGRPVGLRKIMRILDTAPGCMARPPVH